MDAEFPRPGRGRRPGLTSHQLPLPIALPAVLEPTSLPSTAVALLPRQIWASLPPTAQAQAQRAFLHVLQEVIGDAARR
jgi:hypothetical protein